jgi:hypothetical protein
MLGKLKDRLLTKTRVSLFRICQSCSLVVGAQSSKSGMSLSGLNVGPQKPNIFVVFGKDDMGTAKKLEKVFRLMSNDDGC